MYNILSQDLIQKVYEYDNTYRQKYNEIISELKDNFHPNLCGANCKYNKWCVLEGKILKCPVLYRQTIYLCTKCNDNCVSIFGHHLCYRCATLYDEEYFYHHSFCSS